MHGTKTKTIIGTQKCVYGHSPVGRLGKRGGGIVISPLQQGFDSDSEACFSIPLPLSYLPAVRTFDYGIIGTAMSVSQSTAVAAP